MFAAHTPAIPKHDIVTPVRHGMAQVLGEQVSNHVTVIIRSDQRRSFERALQLHLCSSVMREVAMGLGCARLTLIAISHAFSRAARQRPQRDQLQDPRAGRRVCRRGCGGRSGDVEEGGMEVLW